MSVNAPKDSKRAEIKARIAASQARNERRSEQSFTDTVGEKAVEAKDEFTRFAKEHPVATIAGGLALGVLVAAMFQAPRRAAAEGAAKTAGLAALGSEIALAFLGSVADSAGDTARAGGRKLDDFGDAVGDTARSLRREAGYRAGKSGDSARIAARKLSKGITRTFS